MSYQKINSLLEKYFGVRLTRDIKGKTLPKALHPGEGNCIVEFMGASCVGKTRLFQYYNRHRQLTTDKTILSQRELQAYRGKHPRPLSAGYDRFLAALIQQVITKPDKAYQKYAALQIKVPFVEEEYLMAQFENSLFLLEERLLSYVYDELLHYDRATDYLKNRIVIHCTTTPENHIKNIQKRRQRPEPPYHFKGLTGKALYKASQQRLAFAAEKAQKFQEQKARVLQIDTAEDPARNAQHIDAFINRILQKNEEA